MAELARFLQFDESSPTLEVAHTPLVLVVPEMDEDELIRHRAEKFIGSVLVDKTVEPSLSTTETDTDTFDSLHDAIYWAARGNETAMKLVAANVRSEMVEIAIKAGLVIDVELDVDQDGNPLQHGQTLRSVQANALRWASATPQMLRRTKPETRNAFRQAALRNQYLDDYWFVVFSCIPDDMTKEEMDDANFFVETMSYAIQATTNKGAGMVTESAFVAGISEPGAPLKDVETIVAAMATLGIDYSGKDVAALIDSPVLIHKSLMPNGAVDLVALVDSVNGTFYGQNKPAVDYLAHREASKDRLKSFEPMVTEVVQQLINEQATITAPLQAIERLHKLAEGRLVEASVTDRTIDPVVFGVVAAPYIESARRHHDVGNTDLAKNATKIAKKTARSTSCPSAQDKRLGLNKDTTERGDNAASTQETDDKRGTVTCIKCRRVVKKAEVVKPTSWRCPHCKYELDICSGDTINESQPPTETVGLFGMLAFLDGRKRQKQVTEKKRISQLPPAAYRAAELAIAV